MIFDLAGTKREIPSGQYILHLACSGRQSQRGIWFILPSHGASHIINFVIERLT